LSPVQPAGERSGSYNFLIESNELAIVDAYGLTARQRRGFLNQIIEFAICDTAWEADDADHPGDDRTPLFHPLRVTRDGASAGYGAPSRQARAVLMSSGLSAAAASS
jgi:hypothetical protein